MKKEPSGIKIITKNKKAYHDFNILDKFEAGISLVGSEVKSLRDGRANLSDSYVIIKGGEAFLLHAHISPYPPAALMNHEPKRTRKLLLHAKEISKLDGKLNQRGFTLVPTMLYFRKGRVKVQVSLASGKKKYDKRESLKKKEVKRALDRAVRRG